VRSLLLVCLVHDQQPIPLLDIEPAQQECVLTQRGAIDRIPPLAADHRIGASQNG
jgi:hypothetical protein